VQKEFASVRFALKYTKTCMFLQAQMIVYNDQTCHNCSQV